ncbi:MAG TPA: hypothetical protein VFA89_17325 [Terriglobales bacterium]|nr:hypothetical protein [Terriglobales bacterium]
MRWWVHIMERDENTVEIHARILRVVEDLRSIQQELNFAAMQAPTDPELMEALNELPELESIEVLKSALDQMRHFLWFYVQVVTNDSEEGERVRDNFEPQARKDDFKGAPTDALKFARDVAILQYLADGKNRKPN